MFNRRRVLAVAGLLTILLACESGPGAPHKDGPCQNPGEYYTHTNNGKTVSLTCGNDHVWHNA